MKVFLTGGTGFIGQPLTKALLARGWHVVLVRKPDSPEAREMWSSILVEEHNLLSARKKRDLVSRLKPTERASSLWIGPSWHRVQRICRSLRA